MRERKRNRLKNFDYSSDNLYFVTSCIKGREHSFGHVINKKMHLSPAGEIAYKQWQWLINQYPYLISHAFVVMPDHIHGILEISRELYDERAGRDLPRRKIKPLSELMGAYKTTVSKQIHLLGYLDFAWQRSFHERIVRDSNAYRNIKKYIENNPENWDSDEKEY